MHVMTQSRGMATPARIMGRQSALLHTWFVASSARDVAIPAADFTTFSTAPARGSKKNTESCPEFFHDMRRREAAEPLLVVCDGAPGMIRAIDGMFVAHRASALPLSRGAQPANAS